MLNHGSYQLCSCVYGPWLSIKCTLAPGFRNSLIEFMCDMGYVGISCYVQKFIPLQYLKSLDSRFCTLENVKLNGMSLLLGDLLKNAANFGAWAFLFTYVRIGNKQASKQADPILNQLCVCVLMLMIRCRPSDTCFESREYLLTQ
jgi:hypothetical protein